MIKAEPKEISIVKQCNLLGINRSSLYYNSTPYIERCNRGKKVKFRMQDFLIAKKKLIEAKKNEELKKFMKQFETADLLICDEWGYIPFEKEGSHILFQVIADCYEKRSLVVTTNLEFSKWNGIFFDEKLTSAIIDRIVHHGHLLIFNGSSYRLKHSTING